MTVTTQNIVYSYSFLAEMFYIICSDRYMTVTTQNIVYSYSFSAEMFYIICSDRYMTVTTQNTVYSYFQLKCFILFVQTGI